MHFLIRQICFELQDGSLIIRSLPTSPFMKPLQAKENVTSLNADVARPLKKKADNYYIIFFTILYELIILYLQYILNHIMNSLGY